MPLRIFGLRGLKVAVVIVFLTAVVWVVASLPLSGRAAEMQSNRSEVFSPAHTSVGQAVGHFFGIRGKPRQPIAFVHRAHVKDVELECRDCHIAVNRGARAGIPDIRTCWNCHVNTLVENPEIQKVRSLYNRGEDIAWQRVYGWVEEAHVRFDHSPHVRQGVDCSTCHGDVASMGVAERVVEHTMGFCVDCHTKRKASIDCLTCHY